jgi:2-keto-4-pentenoate hydratase/2-oxohepta-3-ene-1,7-dioic acid hydratase in catechol pathway
VTRWARVLHEGARRWARLDDERAALLDGPPWGAPSESGPSLARRDLSLLAPVEPTKVVCVGRNYRKHAEELGNEVPSSPLLFLKPPSSVIGHGQAIERPAEVSDLVHHEGELAVIVGRRLRRAGEDEALSSVLGYTCANDVTARDLQRAEGKFTRAKGFDTFCPVGPTLVSSDEVPDPQALKLELTVDGEVRQSASTADMVFPVAQLLSFISHVMTLEPGDVVLTGTPEGVGPLIAGQTVRVAIEHVGALSNPVVDRPQ